MISVISCVYVLSCKSIGSDTSDAIHKGEDGKYYYAWGGSDSAMCATVCEKAPGSIKEVIEGDICSKEIRYIKSTDYWYPRDWRLPLNLHSIINMKERIDLFYENTMKYKDQEVARQTCLTSDVINRVKNSKNDFINFVSYEDQNQATGTDVIVRRLELSKCNSCPAPSCENVLTEQATSNWEQRCTIKSKDLACFSSQGSNSNQYAVVKEVKMGLSYDEALKYCKTPTNNNYVINWSRVGLANSDFLSLVNLSKKTFWTSSLRSINGITYFTNLNIYIPKESKDVYTVCITPVENLNKVYIYSINTLCP